MAKKTKKQKVGPKPKRPEDKKSAVSFMAVNGDIDTLGGMERVRLFCQDAVKSEAKKRRLETT